MSTLIEELEQAAEGYETMARFPPGPTIDYPACAFLASRLRARIEHVKRQESDWRAVADKSGSEVDVGILQVVLEVIGDIP